MPLDIANTYQHISVHPIAGSMGAEIRGADLGNLSDEVFAEVKSAWLGCQVAVFRDQKITPEQQIALAHRFGEIHHHPFMQGMDDYPDILEIVKEPTDTFTFGSAWHTDQMFNPKPAMATMLYAHEVPTAGGDTMFANMYDAYDALSDGMKAMLADVKTWCVGSKHGSRADRYATNAAMATKVKDPGNLQTESAHPLFRTHPETGRKGLYIGSHVQRLDGFTDAESEPLVKYLKAHAIRPEFTCRVKWQPGTLTLWDNRCVQHYAVPDYNERRRMHRITVAGDVPY
jgi:taurine dioxygenase